MAAPVDHFHEETRRDNVLEGGSRAGLSTPAAIAETSDELSALASPRVSSPTRDAWRRFRHNWAAMLSLVVLAVLIIMALFAPFMHTANPSAPNYSAYEIQPDFQYWFGTDALGQDEYSRVVYGLRVPLIVGLIGTLITVMVGTFIGVIAGFYRGIVDSLMSRFTDLMFAFPSFLLALLVVSLFGHTFDPWFGGQGRVVLLTALFAFVSWPALTRFVRSLALGLKDQQFVEAARTSGSSNWKIMRVHLLPNMIGLILVQAALTTVGIIYNEVALAIFGLGPPPTTPDLGVMLVQGVSALEVSDNLVLFPAIALSLLLVSLTFIGDGVRDAVDPRLNA